MDNTLEKDDILKVIAEQGSAITRLESELLMLREGGNRHIGARVYHNTTQSINNISGTFLTFNSERYDTGGFHDAGAPTKLVAPIDGYYLVGASVQWASNVVGRRILTLYKNTTSLQADMRIPSGAVESDIFHNLNAVLYLEAGDFVEISAYQSSGGALNVVYIGDFTPEFWIAYLGA